MTDDANSFITMGLCWLLTFLSITAHIFHVWDVRKPQRAKPVAESLQPLLSLFKVVNSWFSRRLPSVVRKAWGLDDNLGTVGLVCSAVCLEGCSVLLSLGSGWMSEVAGRGSNHASDEPGGGKAGRRCLPVRWWQKMRCGREEASCLLCSFLGHCRYLLMFKGPACHLC